MKRRGQRGAGRKCVKSIGSGNAGAGGVVLVSTVFEAHGEIELSHIPQHSIIELESALNDTYVTPRQPNSATKGVM